MPLCKTGHRFYFLNKKTGLLFISEFRGDFVEWDSVGKADEPIMLPSHVIISHHFALYVAIAVESQRKRQ